MKAQVKQENNSGKLSLLISVCLLSILLASYFVFPGLKDGVDEGFDVLTSQDQERIADWVSQFGAWGPVAIIIGMVLQMFFFIVPNLLLIFISILSYGPLWGAIIAWFGILLASTVGFFIGNKLSPVIVDRLVSAKTQRTLQGFIHAYGMKAIIALRFSSLSNDGLSLVAGLLEMKYSRFITATLVGITPLIAIVALFGHNGKIQKALVYIGVFLIISLVIYIIIDKRRRK